MGHHDLVLFDLDGTLIRSFMREGKPCPNERCRGGLVWDGESYSEDAGGRLEQKCPTCRGKGYLPVVDAYDLIEALPGREKRLAELREDGTHVAFVTNQGGIAFGYQTEQQILRKMGEVCKVFQPPTALNAYTICWAPGTAKVRNPPVVYVSLGHPNAKVEKYRVDSDWRKPGGGMIRQAMADYGVTDPRLVLFVGDMDSDREAAEAAGVEYADAAEYFAGA